MNSLFEHITVITISACVTAIFAAISVDFYLYHNKQNAKKEKRSIVATGSMTAFYILYYALIRFNVGRIPQTFGKPFIIQALLGALLVVFGTIINIAGRFQLKGNWANHIKIYKNHSLVTNGVYSFARHPLYSSIILMLYGGSIIYSNWLSSALVSIVFVPSMVYRAKQEERLLINEFPEYSKYRQRVGIFFPKRL